MVFIILNMLPLWLSKIIYFLHISYHFARNKNLFNNPPIEIFIISMNNDVLSFKENDNITDSRGRVQATTTPHHSVSDHMQTQARLFTMKTALKC